MMKGFGVVTLVALGVLAAAVWTQTDRGKAILDAVPSVERVYTRWIPPEPPEIDEQISPRELDALSALGNRVEGRLVWSSNRGGNHDLYLADLSTRSVRRLTDDPAVDYFSRFSPDGTQISFLRSRREWVSFREEDAWDLYLMNAEGTGTRRLAEQAYHPTWTPDGSGLVFLRDNAIFHLDLASGREKLLQDGTAPPLEGRIGDPEMAPDGRLVVTVRHRRQRVGILDLDASTYTPISEAGACHIAWFPGGDRAIWVRGEGHGGNRIMHGRPDGSSEILIDLPGDHSHEYFPRISNDGRWLIWGATAEGHEHDRADYEIFAWRLGTAWDTAQRITHTAANDQWPDLYVD